MPKPAAAASKEIDLSKKYDTVVSSGQAALRAFLTMNGGATVAFLAFIGHAVETRALPAASIDEFLRAMQLFIYGTFVAVVAYGTIFLTNCCSRMEWRKATHWMFGVTVACGLLSLVCFVWASSAAVGGLRLAKSVLAAPAQPSPRPTSR